MSDPSKLSSITTSSLPFRLGVLALALLRRWRFVAHDDTERWLGVIHRLLAAYHREPDAFSYVVHQLSPEDGYQRWSISYDNDDNPLIEVEQPIVADLISRRRAGAALDAACGTGRVASMLVKDGHTTTGIDASDAMLVKAVANEPGAIFKSGDLAALPVPDAAFDLVTCCLALTHCSDLSASIAELARCSAPGGTIIVSDIHPLNGLLGGHAGFAYDSNAFAVIENKHHQLGDYIRAFQSAGLRIRECREPSFTETQADGICEVFLANEAWLRTELGPDLTATARAALVGFPLALIWELEKV